MEFIRTGESAALHLIKDQQSVMNEKLDGISRGLDIVQGQLNNPKTGLKRINQRMDALWDQVDRVTVGMEGVKETIESKMEQIIDNTRRLGKRVKTTEAELGIAPPAELTLYE